jgi:hypothetical protein
MTGNVFFVTTKNEAVSENKLNNKDCFVPRNDWLCFFVTAKNKAVSEKLVQKERLLRASQ